MGKGIFEITPELLESVLLLPEGMKILKIQQDHKFNYDTYLVMVEDEHIRRVEPGKQLPEIKLEYKTYYEAGSDKGETRLSGWTTVHTSNPLVSIDHPRITPEELSEMFTE